MVDLAVPPEDEDDEEDEDMEDYGDEDVHGEDEDELGGEDEAEEEAEEDEDEEEDEDAETFGDAMEPDPAGQDGGGFEQHNILHVSGGDVSREFHFLSRSIDGIQTASQFGQGTHHMQIITFDNGDTNGQGVNRGNVLEVAHDWLSGILAGRVDRNQEGFSMSSTGNRSIAFAGDLDASAEHPVLQRPGVRTESRVGQTRTRAWFDALTTRLTNSTALQRVDAPPPEKPAAAEEAPAGASAQ